VKSNSVLEKTLKEMEEKNLIIPKPEKNQFLKFSYKGTGNLISDKWNIKIYNSGSIVCNDLRTIRLFYEGLLKEPDPSLILVKIDDSGWGCPLCGVLIGIEVKKRIIVREIDVKYFQKDLFSTKDYLNEYAVKGMKLLNIIQASPQTHRIEICTGYINTLLKDQLIEKGYDVRIVEIKGKLQYELENVFKRYIFKKTGQNLAYDPKELTKKEIVFKYNKALNWGKTHRPDLLKTGWGALSKTKKKK
jgi:hypothetical protein